MPDLFGAYKNIRGLLPKDQPIAKAYIKIIKGGRFSSNEKSDDPIDDMLSQLEGVEGIDLGEIKSEMNSTMKTLGVTGPFSGFEDNEKIFLQLNPNSYSINTETKFESHNMGGIKNKDKGFGAYPPPKPRTLSVKFYYDSSLKEGILTRLDENEDEIKKVLNADSIVDTAIGAASLYKKFTGAEDLNKLYLDKLLALTYNLEETHTPPLISFNYGSTSFVGYVRQVDVSYNKFNNLGEVTRAEVNLTIEESKDDVDKGSGGGKGVSLSGGSGGTLKNSGIPGF